MKKTSEFHHGQRHRTGKKLQKMLFAEGLIIISKPFDKDIIVNRIKMVKNHNQKKNTELRAVGAYENVKQFSKRNRKRCYQYYS